MRLLACFLTLAALPAAAFNFKGVPADAAMVFATESTADLAISKSPAAQALKARFQKSQMSDLAGLDIQKEIKDATGLDLSSPDISFAGGMYGALASTPDFVLIIRGPYDRSRLDSFCAAQGVKAAQAAGFKGWELPDLVNALGKSPTAQKREVDPPAVFPYDARTLVLVKPSRAAGVFASLKGSAPSYQPGSDASATTAAVGKGYLYLSADKSLMPAEPNDQSGFNGLAAAMGEKGDSQVMKLEVRFTAPDKAAPFAMQAQGMMAMLPLMVAGDPTAPKSPADQAKAKLVSDFVSGIGPVEHKGDRVVFSANWSTERLLTMVNQMLDQAEQDLKNGAAPFSIPGPDDPPAPKRK